MKCTCAAEIIDSHFQALTLAKRTVDALSGGVRNVFLAGRVLILECVGNNIWWKTRPLWMIHESFRNECRVMLFERSSKSTTWRGVWRVRWLWVTSTIWTISTAPSRKDLLLITTRKKAKKRNTQRLGGDFQLRKKYAWNWIAPSHPGVI